jgi:hypothetical protein
MSAERIAQHFERSVGDDVAGDGEKTKREAMKISQPPMGHR